MEIRLISSSLLLIPTFSAASIMATDAFLGHNSANMDHQEPLLRVI